MGTCMVVFWWRIYIQTMASAGASLYWFARSSLASALGQPGPLDLLEDLAVVVVAVLDQLVRHSRQ